MKKGFRKAVASFAPGRLVFLVLFTLLASEVGATHNRAGEITYRQIGPLTIEMTITTYTKGSSTAADRDSLEVLWGDGTSEFVARANGTGEILPNDVKVNKYTQTHTYPGRGTYTISFEDPNRVGAILNVNYPNSIDVPFYLATTFTLLNTQFQGFNNSAVLLQPPIDIACVGQPFIHNPNAYDPDGDSLAYELVSPLQAEGEPVINYKFPNEILSGPNNVTFLNPRTGDFVWISPPQEGEYNIAIKIKEYRKGVLINTIIRDMQIKIIKCQNRPPVISTDREICLVAGDTLDLDVQYTDPDPGQRVLLTATGGPFSLRDSAVLIGGNTYTTVPRTARFYWPTNCNHVREQPYQIVFRAVDDFLADSTGLATFHTLTLRVVAPPPENLRADPMANDVLLSWNLPYACDVTRDNFFQGFSIWRKISPNPFAVDSCTPGLDGRGYTEIVFLTKQNDGVDYFYLDTGLEKGLTYCYRVQAEFALLTPSGNLFNRAESLPSNEICLQISRDLPLITKTSVDQTDAANGEVHLRWTKPLVGELDTAANPPPYQVVFSRSLRGQNDYTSIEDSRRIIGDLITFQDTNYYDAGLNTLSQSYDYKLAFYSASSPLPYGESAAASTIFLSLESSDKRLILNWTEETPWTNYEYDVYKRIDNNWEKIAQTIQPTYLDLNLENGEEYCYYIEARGSYSIKNLEDPIVNRSQIACGRPMDNVAPCAPKLEVENICDNIGELVSPEDLYNTLTWNDPNTFCDRKEVIALYRIYYSADGTDYVLIHEADGQSTPFFEDNNNPQGLAGCYVVTAVDALGNESEFSEAVCIENCPLYVLPNAFTPNEDGANDVFRPRKNIFVERVDFRVFNEWGNLVFQTTDPNLNWDGRHQKSGKEVLPGTYYYTCLIFAEGGETALPEQAGYIQLIR